ncbi:N-acetylmuramoyl-L-alanine amidase [Corticibacter populi]|uniref:N-acetylmuramoyl-L-alanine amidase AmiC n=1 Tax=Corticibacter populi TaxID=1550736 RepID=A0A3M6R0F2_9BURK|nr:N-acetylmuramoyl-L-alanine amidase [Corticibacter populi]
MPAAQRPGNTSLTCAEPTPSGGALGRRQWLQAGTLLCLLGVQHIVRAQPDQRHQPQSASKGGKNGIVAVRIWPAPDYSRVTIESDEELEYTQDFVQNPPRLFVDIKNLRLGNELRNVVTKVQPDDPNIEAIRIAQNSPTVVRMVLDLKQMVRPEVFTLKPVAPYRYRLVFDLYPALPVDPMAQLIAERLQRVEQAPPEVPAAPVPPPASAAPVPAAPALPPPPAAASPDPLDHWISQNGSRPVPAPPPPAPRPAPAPAPIPTPAPAPAPSAPVATARQTDRIIIVALDPGHGGEDPGAIGPAGTHEKNVVLAIALALRERINRSRVNGVPMQAFLTRDRDFFVPLDIRVQKSRRVEADIFISIHADAALNRSARGASVYALSQRGASSTLARWLADKENRADLVGGMNVKSNDRHVHEALVDMSTTAQVRDSLQLAQFIIDEMAKITRMHKRAVEQANFAVLRSPDTPRVLVETAFLSNPEEERLLRSQAHQQRVADAILAGIIKYFQAHPPQPRVRRL